MSLQSHPAAMTAGATVVISPDGSHRIPAELWAEYAAIVLLEPEPELATVWARRIEDFIGVTDAHRRTLAWRAHNRAIRPWTVLRVSPNMERKVRDALCDAGLVVYVPMERYRPARTWRSRLRPLMPGYIFADLASDQDLDTARANYAVREIMCREGRPVKVPAPWIGAMVLAEACKAFDRTWNAPPPKGSRHNKRPPRHAWQRGQRVKVEEGPFSGAFAEIVKADRADRIEVLVMAFGRETPVTMDEEMLSAAALA